MEKDLEFEKAVEEYAEKAAEIESAKDFVEEGFWAENSSMINGAEIAYDTVKELKEDLKDLEEKFGSEIVEAAKEKVEQDYDRDWQIKETIDELQNGQINNFIERYNELDTSKDNELETQFQKEFENNVETVDITKSAEGQAIDAVLEYETAYGNGDNEKLAEAVNEKFDVNFSAEDIQEIREVAQKEMDMEISADFSKDMNMEDIKELNKDDLDKAIEQAYSQEQNQGLSL